MFKYMAWNRSTQTFADQFEPDGDNFIYRKSRTGVPIRVSSEERDHHIAVFNRRRKWMTFGLMAGIVVLSVLEAVYIPDSQAEFSGTMTGAGSVLLIAIFMASFLWAWNAPARELRGRSAAGEARSRADVKRLLLSDMSYQILVVIGGGGIALLNAAFRGDVHSGWNWLRGIAGGLLLAAAGLRAIQKWRISGL